MCVNIIYIFFNSRNLPSRKGNQTQSPNQMIHYCSFLGKFSFINRGVLSILGENVKNLGNVFLRMGKRDPSVLKKFLPIPYWQHDIQG